MAHLRDHPLHEQSSEAAPARRMTDRVWGAGLSLAPMLAAVFDAARRGVAWPWLLAAAAVVLALALLTPGLLAPLRRALGAVGARLGAALRWAILFAAYVLVVVPAGLIMKLTGRDPLHRRLDAAAPSYWIERPPAAPGDFRNQF